MAVREEADRRGELTRPRPSSRAEVARLVDDLRSDHVATRAAAVARLRVIGSRALAQIEAVVASTATASTRAAALAALDGGDDPRAVDVALTALSAPEAEVVVAALSVLRDWVTRETGTRILEALTVVALDKARSGPVRLAALDALSDLPRTLVEPIIERAPVRDEGVAGEDPTALRAWLTHHERTAPLSELHDALLRAHDGERASPDPASARAWLGARGALHVALANRGSRIALYDLRETFDRATGPLPLDFAAAIALIGDATCVESLARAWAASHGEPWWRTRLVECAADLKGRLALSGRHAVVRRVREKWPGFV
jgi:hypothetical protein